MQNNVLLCKCSQNRKQLAVLETSFIRVFLKQYFTCGISTEITVFTTSCASSDTVMTVMIKADSSLLVSSLLNLHQVKLSIKSRISHSCGLLDISYIDFQSFRKKGMYISC